MLIVFISLPFMRPKILIFLINFRSTLLSKSSTVEESSSKIKMISIHELSVFLHFINFCIVRRPHLFHTSDKFELRQAVGSFSNVWKALHSICFLILPVVTGDFIPMAVFRRSIGWQHWNNYSKSFSRIWAFVPAF